MRLIQTTYLNHRGEPVKVTKAARSSNAVVNAVYHMQEDHYAAHLCEVFNTETGVLHAVIKRGVLKITIVFKRETAGVL